jgi:carbon monoxide dehydrogenase subunit G
MRLAGSHRFRAPPDAIWDFLLTPDRLRRCLPGCERFERRDADAYDARLRLGVAFLTGTYSGTVRVVEQVHRQTLRLAVEGGGPLGRLQATGTLHLQPVAPASPAPPAAGQTAASCPATLVTYEGEALVGGPISALGEPVISATADRLIRAFFDCVAAHVE